MKNILIAVMCAGAGVAAGWFWRGSRMEAGSAAAAARVPAQVAATPATQESGRQSAAVLSAAAADHSVALAVEEAEKLRTFTPEAFGKYLADAWKQENDADARLKIALCLQSCGGERAAAFYKELKNRGGGVVPDDQRLREFFTIAGKQDAKGFVTRLLEDSPMGVPQLDSLFHGWALTNADEAVAWMNDLPESAVYYQGALNGLLWGVAEKDPARALAVYEQLGPQQTGLQTLWGLATSTVANHGMQSFVDTAGKMKDPDRRAAFLEAGIERATQRPPAEFVPAMAGQLAVAPQLKDSFDKMTATWAVYDAPAAMKWLEQAAAEPGTPPAALRSMAMSLTRQGGPALEALHAWVAANPGAPGTAVIAEESKGTLIPGQVPVE